MRSAAKNFILLSSSEIISKILGFLTTVVIARRAGIDGLGDIGFVLAVYAYFVLLANPGYDTIGMRESVAKVDESTGTINSIFILKFWSALAAWIILLGVCILFPISPVIKQLLLIQGLSLLTIPFSFQFFFRGENQMHIVALSRVLQSSVYFISVYFVVQEIGDLIRVPMAFGAAAVIGLLPMIGLIRHHCSLRMKVKKERLRSLFVASFTVGAAAICVQVYLNIDTVLLGIFKTSREVGLYTSAYKIVTLASAIPMLLFTSFLPFLISAGKIVSREWKTYVLMMFAVGLPVGISLVIFAPLCISILYGAEFQGAILPLRILSFDVIAVFASITFAQPLLLLGKEKKYLSIVAWSAGTNMILNLFMIPWYGMIGAAMTTVFAESLLAFRSWKAMKQETESVFTKEIFVIALIAGIAGLLIYVLSGIFTWNRTITGVSFIALYGILIAVWYTHQRRTQRGTH